MNKKRRNSVSENLVESSGADFLFLDRNRSFNILGECLNKRFDAWKQKKRDRNLHPIPFLADGPGSGKSRFLQELPATFRSFVTQSSLYSDEFKKTFDEAVFINVTFGNGSTYSPDEIGIQKSLCLRILFQITSHQFASFPTFYDNYKTDDFTLSEVMEIFSDQVGCIVLGIDEVNKVHSASNERFKELFNLVGGYSCPGKPARFFVPILAGTVIGPMKSVVTKSTHPPLHIPLPLLSFDSCLQIIAKKDPTYTDLVQENHELRMLISDVGGHCRALEILYDGLARYERSVVSSWDFVATYVQIELEKRYSLSDFPFAAAIAYYFLSLDVKEQDDYPDEKSMRFMDLEEKGILKVVDGKLSLPYVFVVCFLLMSKTTAYSKFWANLLIGDNFWWQDWEDFNRNYVAFRLSLYSYLGIKTVTLKQFFNGARTSFPDDYNPEIQIPAIDEIKVSKINNRYPSSSTSSLSFSVGDSVLNADGAPFDSFVYVKTALDSHPLLLAFQMKLAGKDSQSPQIITACTINAEFNKINNSISKCIPGTDFICVILGRCEGKFTEHDLPGKCIVVSEAEQVHFYGPSYFQRLNRVRK